jgi:hypothetical protein
VEEKMLGFFCVVSFLNLSSLSPKILWWLGFLVGNMKLGFFGWRHKVWWQGFFSLQIFSPHLSFFFSFIYGLRLFSPFFFVF